MGKVIAHIDLNAFFANAEVLRNPSLKDKPLVIGHRGRGGIVSTCSYKAREYGIHSGMPTFQADKLCKNLIVVEPDFSYYKMMSNSFFAIVKEYVKDIEVASIDECYADFSEAIVNVKDPIAYFQHFQNDLYKRTGLTASIGIAPTKWLAKMASDLKKPMGLTIIRKKDIPSILYGLPIESFWGIGKKSSPKLRELGINTIGDFAEKAKVDDPILMRFLGKFFFTAKEWVLGGGENTLDLEPWDPKSIGNSSTLSHDCSEFYEIEGTLKMLCMEVASRMKEAHKVGNTLTLTVKDTEGSFHLHSRADSFPSPTDSFDAIYALAERLYKDNFDGVMEIRLVGVALSRLEDKTRRDVQMSFWNYQEFEEMDKTRLFINEMNRHFDKDVLIRASEAKKK